MDLDAQDTNDLAAGDSPVRARLSAHYKLIFRSNEQSALALSMAGGVQGEEQDDDDEDEDAEGDDEEDPVCVTSSKFRRSIDRLAVFRTTLTRCCENIQ